MKVTVDVPKFVLLGLAYLAVAYLVVQAAETLGLSNAVLSIIIALVIAVGIGGGVKLLRMKEPYEIFHDEFVREAKRLSRNEPLDMDGFREAVAAAYEATAFRLINHLHFHPGDAEQLALEFVHAADEPTEKTDYLLQLRNTYTDWQLKHP